MSRLIRISLSVLAGERRRTRDRRTPLEERMTRRAGRNPGEVYLLMKRRGDEATRRRWDSPAVWVFDRAGRDNAINAMQNWTSLSNVSFGRRCNAVTAGKGERAITSPGAAVYLRVPSRHRSKWWQFLGKFANERIHAWNFSRLIGAKREIDWRRYLVYDNCPPCTLYSRKFLFYVRLSSFRSFAAAGRGADSDTTRTRVFLLCFSRQRGICKIRA